MRTELSVIIPAFNEESRIEPTIVATDAYLARLGICYEIIVVDDGSTDGTEALVADIARHLPTLRLISYRPNRGKGHAVRVGMLSARGEVRLMCDADGSTPPTQMPKLLAEVSSGRADIAIGSRYIDGAETARKQPFYRRLWSRLANRVVRRALVGGIRDTQCGFKAFSASAAERIFRLTRIDGWAFDLEALALARRMGLGVREVGVSWADDPRSRIHPLRDAWRVVRELVLIRANLRRGVYGRLAPAPAG